MSTFTLQNIGTIQMTDTVGTVTGACITPVDGGVSVDGYIVATGGVSAGTLRLTDGSITDTGGTISFGNENLSTTGGMSAQGGMSAGSLVLSSGSIIETSGGLSFSTTGGPGTTITLGSATDIINFNGAYNFPTSDGTNGFVLQTDGVGSLTFAPPGGGGGGATDINGLTDAFADTSNVVLGVSPQSISGSDNVGIGVSALNAITSGSRNIALGFDALIAGTTASDSIAIGYSSLRTISTGTLAQNVAIGTSTLSVMTGAGGQNVAIGYIAGQNVIGSENTIVGASAGITLTSGQNNSLIGFGAEPTTATVSNEFTLGNGSVLNLRCADTTIASLSDARDKTDVEDSRFGIDFLNNVRPVEFTWQRRNLVPGDENNNKNGLRRVGFLAQELQEAMSDGENDILDLVYESNPDRLEAKYGNLIPILVKAVKDLKAEVDTLKQRMDNCSC